MFSTEQGLCGRFNEILLDETRKRLKELGDAEKLLEELSAE